MDNINRITREDIAHFRATITYNGTRNLLDQYQKIAGQSAVYPGKGTPIGLMYVALKGAGEAGEFAEHVGKALRDDDLVRVDSVHTVHMGGLTPDRREALIKECGDQLWYIQAKCRELGITLSQCALINLEKLCDRGERNQLQGSGDNR